jgi:hypothetical protein
MKKHALLVLGMLLWLPVSLSAQAVTSTGTRVRMGTKNQRLSAGLLLAVSSDSLLIGFQSSGHASGLGAQRCHIVAKEPRWRWPARRNVGAQLGLVAGAIGFGVEHLMSRSSDPRFHYDNVDLASAAVSGAVWGFLGGAIMGAIIGEERWEDAALPQSSEPLPSFAERSELQTDVRLRFFRDGKAIRLRTQDGQQIQGRYDGQANGLVRITADSSYLVPIASIRKSRSAAR